MVADESELHDPSVDHLLTRAQAQMDISEVAVGDITLPLQGYLDLIKASWILVDVIARHPQLNLLDTTVRYEVEILTEVSCQ